jgi:hypothetical protein
VSLALVAALAFGAVKLVMASAGLRALGTSGAEVPVALPTYDVLGFLAACVLLPDWQRELLEIVRAEAYYFLPQRMTKIMNEGWASYWHARLLTGGVLCDSEVIDFADCHSGATADSPGRVNPYKLGIELFRCAHEQGLDIFRLRRVHNDASLIDLLVDERFIDRQRLFLYGQNSKTGRTEVVERDPRRVKAKLMQDLSWGGLPQIELVGTAHGRREACVCVDQAIQVLPGIGSSRVHHVSPSEAESLTQVPLDLRRYIHLPECLIAGRRDVDHGSGVQSEVVPRFTG